MSRLIKSNFTNLETNKEKIISIKYIPFLKDEEDGVESVVESAPSIDSQQLIDEAKAEAEKIMQQAYAEIEAQRQYLQQEQLNWAEEKQLLIEAARNEGFQEGLDLGRQAGYSEYEQTISEAKNVVEASKKDYDAYIQSSEKEILSLGMKTAEKIVNKIIGEETEYFFELVKKVLKEAKDQKEIQLHVHPSKYEYVLADKEDLLALFPIQPNIFIYPDETLHELGCIIESANGKIDASVDKQLDLIKEKLIELMESESE